MYKQEIHVQWCKYSTIIRCKTVRPHIPLRPSSPGNPSVPGSPGEPGKPYKIKFVIVSFGHDTLGLDLSRRPPSAGQAPLAVLRGSLGIAHVQLSCVTDVGLVCVVEHCDLTELKEVLLLLLLLLSSFYPPVNCKGTGKLVYSSCASSLTAAGTYNTICDHSVTCCPAEVTLPHLSQPIQAGTRSPEGCKAKLT